MSRWHPLRWLRTPHLVLWVLRFIAPMPVAAGATPSGAGALDPPINFDCMLGLTLYSALCVVLARLLPGTAPDAVPLFWLGLALLFVLPSIRIAAPRVARAERLWLLIVLALATFALKFLYDPTNFVQFDEFLHWESANDLLTTHRLFTANPNLPAGVVFPGLELVTTAFVSLTGLSVFAAGNIVVMAARILFITALFAFCQKITGSARLAGIACLFYMGSSVYVMFDSQFAYESLAMALMAGVLLAEAELVAGTNGFRGIVVAGLILAALMITHHITALITVGLVCAEAALLCIGRSGESALPTVRFAGVAAAIAAVWLLVSGGALGPYLLPILSEGGQQLARILHGGTPQRQFFTLAPGEIVAPLWLQVETIAGVLVLALLLSFGFFTSVAAAARGRSGWMRVLEAARLRFHNSRLVLVTLIALGWPLTILLRLTPNGWQIGNRGSAYVFVGVGMVAAFGVVRFWGRSGQQGAGVVTGVMAALVVVGGTFSGWGVVAVRSDYRVEADSLSFEPLGIDAARWTRQFLGSGNTFAADRDNRMLLATYGRQKIITNIFQDAGTAYLYILPRVSQQLRDEIQEARLDYLLVDIRMATHAPYLGTFFEDGEPRQIEDAPLPVPPLEKWDSTPGVSRVFDDGWIHIYDVRGLQHAA